MNSAAKKRQWTELYRPNRVSQMIGNNTQRQNLVRDIIDGVSHVLLAGPPGTGKTTTALGIARELFPYPQDFKDRVYELNASTDRGVGVVRDVLIHFVRRDISRFQQTADPNSNALLPPVRIVILDEADRMTHDAQAVLRQMTEKYGENGVRFFIICNYPSDIIVPIRSRCLKVRFDPPPLHEIAGWLRSISTVEKLFPLLPPESQEIFTHIAKRSNGDMRQAIHTLQHIAQQQRAEQRMRGAKKLKIEPVKEFIEHIDVMNGFIPERIIDQLTDILLNVPSLGCDFPKQDRWCDAAQLLVIDQGFSVGKCLEQLSSKLMERAAENDKLSTVVAHYMYRLSKLDVDLHSGGGDPTLCLYSLYHSCV